MNVTSARVNVPCSRRISLRAEPEALVNETRPRPWCPPFPGRRSGLIAVQPFASIRDPLVAVPAPRSRREDEAGPAVPQLRLEHLARLARDEVARERRVAEVGDPHEGAGSLLLDGLEPFEETPELVRRVLDRDEGRRRGRDAAGSASVSPPRRPPASAGGGAGTGSRRPGRTTSFRFTSGARGTPRNDPVARARSVPETRRNRSIPGVRYGTSTPSPTRSAVAAVFGILFLSLTAAQNLK